MKEKKSFWKIGICMCIVFASIFSGFYVCAEEEKEDWIEIVSVSPNHFENYTEPVTFTATIKYSLQSYERGIIYMGFNTDKAECYTYSTDPGDVRIVSQGNGTVKDFMIYAMLCKYPQEDPPMPLADYAAVLKELPDVSMPVEILYGDSTNPTGEQFSNSLEELIDNTDSVTYDPELAHMLIALCNSVHDENNMSTTLLRMGFHDRVMDYDFSEILLAYGIGKKQVGDETYVLVVARGTGDFNLGNPERFVMEWLSNIMDAAANKSGQHSGMSDAANELYDIMLDFLDIEHIEEISDMNFIITGHSRGAGVANILAARLLDEGIAKEKIHAYTFACPDTAVITQEKAEQYECIFNIGNANDMVTWIPRAVWEDSGEKDGFGKDSYWNKYGNSLWYCEDWEDYQNLHNKFTANISVILDWTFQYHLQNVYLDYLKDEKEVEEYKNREETTEAIRAAADRRREERKENIKSPGGLLSDGGEGIISIKLTGPVNVEIADESENMMVSTKGDKGKIYEGAEEKALLSFYDNQQRIFLINEEDLCITLRGTDEGVMQFSIILSDVFQETVVAEKNFHQVELYAGKKMRCNLSDNDGIANLKLFLVEDKEERIAEIVSDGTEKHLSEETSREDKGDVQAETYIEAETKAKVEMETEPETKKARTGKNITPNNKYETNMEKDDSKLINSGGQTDLQRVLFYIIIVETMVIMLVILQSISKKRNVPK